MALLLILKQPKTTTLRVGGWGRSGNGRLEQNIELNWRPEPHTLELILSAVWEKNVFCFTFQPAEKHTSLVSVAKLMLRTSSQISTTGVHVKSSQCF